MVDNITITHDGDEYRYVAQDGVKQWLSSNDEVVTASVSSKLEVIAVESGVDSDMFKSEKPVTRTTKTSASKIKIFDN